MQSILDSIAPLASASSPSDAARVLERWSEDAAIGSQILTHPTTKRIVEASAGNSPYLARLLIKHPMVFERFATEGANHAFAEVVASLDMASFKDITLTECMKRLRIAKQQSALVVALADITLMWDLAAVTRQLSAFAQKAVDAAIHWLLMQAVRRGEFEHAGEHPAKDSGIIVLGMGKLGAFELNYSSDIDLIILFEKDGVPYRGSRGLQHFMTKFAQDLVQLMQERTEDGYVLRTDLRLRPDPMSTPPAVNALAALTYYETVGQNWERAAMIKARPISGDIDAGERFLKELIPYIWRKYLDFATIADIHSIKRQMNAVSGSDIVVRGHNIKTGPGGIREIEFFVQTQQLVWGGRMPQLRVRGTVSGLEALSDAGLLSEGSRDDLMECYAWFRKVEHALQMRADEQTHSVPTDDEGVEWLRVFLDYDSAATFEEDCLRRLRLVHRYYLDSMEGGTTLASGGNLVFTGVEADPSTLNTLEGMGYKEARAVSDIIQNWHRGSRKSTRSKRSRQVLTELVPQILRKLSETANPDAAFFHFDDFLAKLPSGAQIFSLFSVKPELLTLVADILGSAPALADSLSRDPTLLDAVMETDFYGPLASRAEMTEQLRERIRHAHDYEHRMTALRIFNNDKRFQAGVQMLKGQITPAAAGEFLSDVAEAVLEVTMGSIMADLEKGYPALAQAKFAVLGFGKLGGREMTFDSDLDIVFVYDDSAHDLERRTQIHRLSQRLVSALTLLTREGRLYEVDTRLRPGGADGPMASSVQGFDLYFGESAWTFELQALTKARVVASTDEAFGAQVDAVVAAHVLRERDGAKLLAEIRDMRGRIAKEHTTRNPWHVKHVRGGLVDVDFIAQYLVLRYAPGAPRLWQREASAVFAAAMEEGVITADAGTPLIEAKQFLSALLSVSRLVSEDILRDENITPGFARTLAEALGCQDFASLKERMLMLEARVVELFEEFLPAQGNIH